MSNVLLQSRPAAGRRVLFVNADADLRAVVRRVLEAEGFSVETAAHSGHAVLLCRVERFDVVVAEVCGPDMSGPSLVQQLRRHNPALSSVFLGNAGSPEGLEQLLVRPFTKEDLVARIELAASAVAV